MDKNIASEVVNKFEKAKQAIEKLEQEIENYRNATIYLNKSADNLELISKEVNKLLLNTEQIEKEVLSILTGDMLKKFNTEVSQVTVQVEKLDNKIACEEKLEYLYEQKKELEELNKIINLAKETLEESYDEIKKNITPKFTKELSNNIEMISDGKYKKANFNSDTGLTIEAENGEYIECNKLSIGTIDQLYLSLRLSATKEITKETIPIILDESFAYFDNQRLENVIKYLDSNYNNQIIIFTCTNREKEILDKLNIEYNLVNL